MKIEHVAYMYPRPAETAAWYVEHLGFKVVRKMDAQPFMHFIADSTGKVMIEIYNNPVAKILDYANMPALQLHLAFVSADPKADRDRLIKAGATLLDDLVTTPAGDELIMLRDPWGFAIQLCKRANPMV
jgi:glyoxylase I family protein